MMFLQNSGVGASFGKKIFKIYGTQSPRRGISDRCNAGNKCTFHNAGKEFILHGSNKGQKSANFSRRKISNRKFSQEKRLKIKIHFSCSKDEKLRYFMINL